MKASHTSTGTVTYGYDNDGALATVTDSATYPGGTTAYQYDHTGLRTRKTYADNSYTIFDLVEGKAVGETRYTTSGTVEVYIRYIFDESGVVNGIGLWYPGDTAWTDYYFAKNLQGDVLEVYDSAHHCVATYSYDSWGNIISQSGSLAELNPFRYRSYYFDQETELYYLQSRYYDPQVGRFINADAYASTGQGLLGNNMFAYCGNNPINNIDPTGHFWGVAIMACLAFAVSEYYQLILSIAEANYEHNSAVDVNHDTTTHNKLVNDQNGRTGELFQYGLYSASWNGCETIAIHNAKVLLGMDSTLSSTMRDCQMAFAMYGVGTFGTSPTAIGRVLDNYGISYITVGLNQMTQSGVYIISYWNNVIPRDGLHTVAVFYDGTTYTTYNLRGNGSLAYGPPSQYVKNGNYICGYFLG